MPQIDGLFGSAICGFGLGLGALVGHIHDAVNLCVYIQTNDL